MALKCLGKTRFVLQGGSTILCSGVSAFWEGERGEASFFILFGRRYVF